MKVPDGGCVDCVLAHKDIQTSDGQGGMSKKAARSDVICEYRQWLRERISAEQPTFNHGGAREAGMEVYKKNRNRKGEIFMNLAALMQFKTEWDGFKARHPKFPLFLTAAQQRGISEGTVIELQITAPDGTVLNSNLKIQPEDLEMFRKMREMLS